MTRHYQVPALFVAAMAVLGATITMLGAQVAGVQQPATPAQAPPPVVGTGAISGVVIDGSTNQPISGAIVTLSGGARGGRSDPGRVSSDAMGRFVFPRLVAATYTVSAEKHGYGNARHGQTDPSSAGRNIALTDGQWFPEGRIAMWRTSAISGTITDEAGEPQVGVLVRVMTRITVGGRPQLASGTAVRTDDRGRYRVPGLGPDRYVVMVPSVQAAVPSGLTLEELGGITAENQRAAEAQGRPLTIADPTAISIDAANRLVTGGYLTPPPSSTEGWSYPPVFFPNAQTIGAAETIDLGRAEERRGVDIRMTPVRSVRVSGVLEGPPASITGMTVRLLPAGNESLGYGAEVATALAGANGAFTLLRVPAGNYTIAVSRTTAEYGNGGSLYAAPTPPGCAGGGGGGFFSMTVGATNIRASYRNCGGDATHSARMPLTVGDRDMSGVVVPLQRAVSISGRIVYADGPPAPDSIGARVGTTIFAEPANGDASLGWPSSRSMPGETTAFKIDGLLAGAYVLQVQNLGSVGAKSIEWQGRDYTDRPFDTTAGRDIDSVVITMTSAATTVKGAVRDAKGAPATTGLLIVFPVDRTMWTNYGLRPARIKAGPISVTGTYSILLPAGEYYIASIDAGASVDVLDPRFLEAASVGATRITLTLGETKTVDLSQITVKVTR